MDEISEGTKDDKINNQGLTVRFSEKLTDSDTIDLFTIPSVQGIVFKPTMSNFASNHFNRTLKRLTDSSPEMSLPEEPELFLRKKSRLVHDQVMHLKAFLSESNDDQDPKPLDTEDNIISAAQAYILGLERATCNMDERIKRLSAVSSTGNRHCSVDNDSIDGCTTIASDQTSSSSLTKDSNMNIPNTFRTLTKSNLSINNNKQALRTIQNGLALALMNLDAKIIQSNELFCVTVGWNYPAGSDISILPLIREEDRCKVVNKLAHLKRKFQSITPCHSKSSLQDMSCSSTSSRPLANGSSDPSDSCSIQSTTTSTSSASNGMRANRYDLEDLIVGVCFPNRSPKENMQYKLLISTLCSADTEDVTEQLSIMILLDDHQL